MSGGALVALCCRARCIKLLAAGLTPAPAAAHCLAFASDLRHWLGSVCSDAAAWLAGAALLLTWGAPKPRMAVLLGWLVLQILPTNLMLGVARQLSACSSPCTPAYEPALIAAVLVQWQT